LIDNAVHSGCENSPQRQKMKRFEKRDGSERRRRTSESESESW
jgi:hypothetical protein